MDDQICPRCKTSRYRNPSLKLMVNVCGHSLCENCVELLFIKGSGSCPQCGTVLKRNSYRLQLFEDASVEKEVDIRKRVLKDYNKREDDFASLEEYNDYLEEIESIIYNLCNGIDVFETNKKIDQYKRENKEIIDKNRSRFNRELKELDRLLDEEKKYVKHHREVAGKQEIELKKRKIMKNEALIDELMFSDCDAKEILNFFAENRSVEEEEPVPLSEQNASKESKIISHFSSGIKIGDNNQLYGNVPKIEEGPLYVYVKPEVIVDGPEFPSWDQLEPLNYLSHVRQETADEKAGGFSSSLACMRALQEAMFGLYNTAATNA